jgi:flagellar hook-length control protein FliK
MRVELYAQSDAGREAVRGILPDLRRDMQAAGISLSVDVSSQNQPSTGSSQGGQGQAQQNLVGQHSAGRQGDAQPGNGQQSQGGLASSADRRAAEALHELPTAATRAPLGSATSIDVMA